MWIGGYGGGLYKHNIDTGDYQQFVHEPSDPHSLSNNIVNIIYQDSQGTLWIGTDKGLNKFDSVNNQFESFQYQQNQTGSLSHNVVITIAEDQQGTLWVGTANGLNAYDSNTGLFVRYGQQEGLTNDTIAGILSDGSGALWVSTKGGLFRFDPLTKMFKTFTQADGLQSNDFHRHTNFKAADGELIFGGANGFNRFYGERIVDDNTVPKVVLTDLILFNQLVRPGQTTESGFDLPMPIDQMSQLTINHHQSLISFEFSTLDYRDPARNQYRYKLEGLDEDWRVADAKIRRATYTNLPGGDYVLRVKGSNKNGVWNETSLKLYVLPPPWRTWWAYTMYTSVVMAILLAFIRLQRNKVHIEREANRQLKQVDKLKDEFLANTSHELRTPLNGIIGLTDSLMSENGLLLSDEANHRANLIKTSATRLSFLIDDILDFSKLKNNELAINRKSVSIRELVGVVVPLCRPLLKTKAIKLNNEVSEGLPKVCADENRVQQVLYNLLGNAIKFTHKGSVTITTTVEAGFVWISISDTGIGIEQNKLESVFTPFEQISGDISRQYGGTGLGLSISRKLIELQGGQVKIDSTVEQGTRVQFSLPVYQQIGQSDVDTEAVQTIPAMPQYDLPQAPEALIVTQARATNEQQVAAHLLLVDDDPINLQVLVDQFHSEFTVTTANDGLQALDALDSDDSINLVILDVMMPVMNGYEACEKIRQRYSSTQLPVILLTAKTQTGDMIKGLANGANDYVSKPFDRAELSARVNTQLQIQAAANERVKQAQIKAILDVSEQPILAFYGQGEIGYSNDNMQTLLGKSHNELTCEPLSRFIAGWQNLDIFVNDDEHMRQSIDITLNTGANRQMVADCYHITTGKTDIYVLYLNPAVANNHDLQDTLKFQQMRAVISQVSQEMSELTSIMNADQSGDGLTLANSEKLVNSEKLANSEKLVNSDAQLANSQGSAQAFGELLVNTMRSALNYWEIGSQKPKSKLISESEIWSGYLDSGTYRSRTFDRYLQVKTLPKKPKWQKVVRTAHYVLDNCPLDDKARQNLEHSIAAITEIGCGS
ncbi:MAG: signal transduction histidine kinase/DNA-binding response OmpR family regulator [Phenylobacterium sp.]|jgi:signal transduction histidine kinase/DNA-binding response OmpR family regulator